MLSIQTNWINAIRNLDQYLAIEIESPAQIKRRQEMGAMDALQKAECKARNEKKETLAADRQGIIANIAFFFQESKINHI
jgi:glycine cleavage system regulatory protein